MADIVTNTLQIGSNNLVLRDADAQTRITTLEADTSTLKEDITQVIDSAYVTDTASGAIASFTDGAEDMPVKSLTVDIEPVQSGSGDPSPLNVRPISGFTGANINVTGKNLIKNSENSITSYGVTWTVMPDGTIVANGTASGGDSQIYVSFNVPPGDYYFNGCPSGESASTYDIYAWDNILGARLKKWDKSTASASDVGGTQPQQINIPEGHSVQLNCRITQGATVSNLVFKPMVIMADETDYTFEPYKGNVYSITFPTSAGTVYGGTLDVTSGVLTVNWANVDMGTIEWLYSDSGYFYAQVSGKAYGNFNLLCTKYATTTAQSVGNMTDKQIKGNNGANYIYIKDSTYTDATTFKTSLSGTMLVYELGTPVTYQLDATAVNTILGQNNIFADTGDIEVEYRADTKLYIEKLTAPTEDDMIADHAISANTFFMVGNTLYRATTAIASGATITVGTNATRLSLADALNTLS